MAFGDALRCVRISHGLRQVELARCVGAAQETLSQYETERRPCLPDVVAAVALILSEPKLLEIYCEHCPIRKVAVKEVV